MRKKLIRLTALVLMTGMLAGSTQTGALSFNDLDASTAVGGASAAISNYYCSNENAPELIAEILEKYIENSSEAEAETDAEAEAETEAETAAGSETEGIDLTEIIYDEPKYGVADPDAFLNIRKEPSSISEPVDILKRGAEIEVLGVVTKKGMTWYKILNGEIEGYVAANFVIFGDDAQTLAEQVKEEEAEANKVEMATECKLLDDISGLDENTVINLKGYINEANWVLTNDYPESRDAEAYSDMYMELIYLQNMYQYAEDIAVEYNLTETLAELKKGLTAVVAEIQNVEEAAGKTGDEILAEVLESKAEETTVAETAAQTAAAQTAAPAATAAPETAAPAATEAPAAETAAPAAETAAPTEAAVETAAPETAAPAADSSIGSSIAAYAASFVGTLPYVWGGASLTNGADCSGFVSQIMAHFGLLNQSVANYHGYDSASLRSVGYEVSVTDIQPGDIVCYNGHVAIYYGNGQVIHEPAVGRKCEVGILYMAQIITIRRLY